MFGRGPLGQRPQRLLKQSVERELLRGQRQFTGFIAGIIQHIARQVQQRVSRLLGQFQTLALLGRQLLRAGQLQHPQDSVQRGADLVGHVGEKRALSLSERGGLFGQFLRQRAGLFQIAVRGHQVATRFGHHLAGPCQLFGPRFSVADVTKCTQELRRLTRNLEPRSDHFVATHASSAGRKRKHNGAAGALLDTRVKGPELPFLLAAEQTRNAHTLQFRRRLSNQLAKSLIGGYNGAFHVVHTHGFERCIPYEPEVRFSLIHFWRRMGGDIDSGADHEPSGSAFTGCDGLR